MTQEESEKYWAFVRQTRETVRRWPAWMRSDAALGLLGGVQAHLDDDLGVQGRDADPVRDVEP